MAGSSPGPSGRSPCASLGPPLPPLPQGECSPAWPAPRPATSRLVGLRGDPKDRAQAKLYHLQVESVLEGDDAGLHASLVCAHQDQDVPERHILCGLCVEPDRFRMLALIYVYSNKINRTVPEIQ